MTCAQKAQNSGASFSQAIRVPTRVRGEDDLRVSHEETAKTRHPDSVVVHRQNHLESVDTPKSVFVCEGNKAFIDILRVWPEDIFIWERRRAPTELYRLAVRGRWRP